MQAYKHKAIVNESGELVFKEPINITPGEVEVIILQVVEAVANSTVSETEAPEVKTKRKVPCKVEAFRDLFENTEPAPPDFDPDEARWEALKEKHNL